MEKNGKASSSKRTKHINIRYYFVTDRISKKDLTVEWCPTGDMIGDYMTKPNQGALFTKFRDQIMGVIPAKNPGPGKVKSNKNLVQQSSNVKLAHRSVLDGEHKRTSDGQSQKANGRCTRKSKKQSSVTKKLQQRANTKGFTSTLT
jgi:hypothetical protein